jgi:hypothetical protein
MVPLYLSVFFLPKKTDFERRFAAEGFINPKSNLMRGN